jgi:enamine deaminase RidA (YjgF/YER057c/UK114 family)
VNRVSKSFTGESLAPDDESPELRLKRLGVELPLPPEPFGVYAEAVQTGNLLFLTGMLPTEGRRPKFVGRLGAELNVEGARDAARLAAMNALAVARQHLGSLDKVTRIVRLGVLVATSGRCSRTAESRRRCVGIPRGRLRKRKESESSCVRRCEPSSGNSGRAGSHFRSGGLERTLP